MLIQVRDILDTGSFQEIDDHDGVFPREISDKYSVLNDDDDEDEDDEDEDEDENEGISQLERRALSASEPITDQVNEEDDDEDEEDDDDEDEDEDEGVKEGISQLEQRALGTPAPLTKQISGDGCDDREGLYVPMMYAGYISSDGKKWRRYQCDANDAKDKCKEEKNGKKLPAMAITDGLATCVSLSVISRQGVIKTHIPPYICEYLFGGGGNRENDDHLKRQAQLIREANRKLVKKYLPKMGGPDKVTTIAVTGGVGGTPDHDSHEARQRLQARAASLVRDFYDLDLNYWDRIPAGLRTSYPTGARSTSVDLTQDPPAFYLEDGRLAFPIP